MEVFSKEELIDFLKPMHQRIADLEQQVSFLEEQLSEKVRTMKTPEVQKILGLSWEQVRTRIDRKTGKLHTFHNNLALNGAAAL